MKAKNLERLIEYGMQVPAFIVIEQGDDVDLSFSTKDKFAVRSSFQAEDSPNNSFAGQFDTLLNVSREDVYAAVLKVFESTKSETVEHYVNQKDHNSLDVSNMRVIVQEMVEADCAGVIFTKNPMGILNEMVLVVGKGLGDKIVEDKVETTTYYYNVDEDRYDYEVNGESQVLSDTLVRKLFEAGKKIEASFLRPMDIEYAIKGDEVYILQARPITTLNYEREIVLDNSNIVESYPGVCAPLTRQFITEIYYRVFRSMVFRITKDSNLTESMDDNLKHMTAIANGRAYYCISNWYGVLKLLPFEKKIIKVWQEMLGVQNKSVIADSRKVKLGTKITLIHSLMHYLRVTPKLMEELNSYFSEYLIGVNERYDEIKRENSEETIKKLLDLYEEMFDELACRWDITLINDMYAFIYTALAGKKNKTLIANIKNLESMKPVKAIEKLTEIAKEIGMDSEAYRNAKEDYVNLYGDRCLNELKLETKTYRTNPELLDDYIKKRVDRFVKSEGSDVSMEENKESKNLFVKRAKLGIKNREISRLNRTRIFGMVRSIMLTCGEELVSLGYMDQKEDIFYISIPELHEMNDKNDYHTIRQMVIDRKEEEILLKAMPTYGRLIYADTVKDRVMKNSNTGFDSSDGKLSGIPASDGDVTGEVMVIDDPSLDLDTTGKILVTKMTDPGWVFLIENASGIIAEKGSILSHTAIITRELHICSIVNVKDATKILKTGDRVHMNGATGEIEILS